MSHAVALAPTTSLNVDDLLRLSVLDQRLATALIRQPSRFERAFNLSATSMTAISEAISFNDTFVMFHDCGCDRPMDNDGTDYE